MPLWLLLRLQKRPSDCVWLWNYGKYMEKYVIEWRFYSTTLFSLFHQAFSGQRIVSIWPHRRLRWLNTSRSRQHLKQIIKTYHEVIPKNVAAITEDASQTKWQSSPFSCFLDEFLEADCLVIAEHLTSPFCLRWVDLEMGTNSFGSETLRLDFDLGNMS